MDGSYTNGSGKFPLLSWHLSFALIAPCLKSSLFCLPSVTLHRLGTRFVRSSIGH
jgi:hypothetical protein